MAFNNLITIKLKLIKYNIIILLYLIKPRQTNNNEYGYQTIK